MTLYESPRSGVGHHPDANNLRVEMVEEGLLRIYSKNTRAQLSIQRMRNGMWIVRHNLSWPGFGFESGERQFTTEFLRRAFNIQEHPEAMFTAPGRFHREGNHLTVPPWHGEVVDGVPCMSINLSPAIQHSVRKLIEDEV